jgi:hypothetical protein
LLREEDNVYGIEVHFEASDRRPASEKLALAEAVLQESRRLTHVGAEYLSMVFSGSPLNLTPDNLQLVWVEFPEVSALDTGTFGMVYTPEFDPYLQLTVWFDARIDDLAAVRPKHCTFRWS